MSLRDFVDPSCGVPNAMSSLARGTAEMAAHIQEARAFDAGLKGVERGPGGPPMDMLANAPPLHAMGPGADVDAFMHQFQQGPKLGGPPSRMHRSGIPYFAPPPPMFDEKMAMPRMPPPHMMHGPMHNRPLDVDSMVNEFSQMGMHGPPQDEFERIYNNSFHGPPPPHMLHARAHMPPHMMEPLRSALPAPLQIAPAPPSAAELESAYQEAIAGPPPGQAEAAHPWAAEFEQMNQFRERMGQPPVQAPATEADLEDAYNEATSEKPAWVDEFLNEQTSRPAEGAGGMSMGMDKDLVDRLLASGNPKWQNSKFLNLLQKVSKGQVEFKDGQILEKPGPAPGDDWASEFQQSQRPLGDQWAGEFDRMHQPHQQQPEWVREFEDAHPELYGQDEKVDAEFDTTRGAAWADELAQQELGGEEFGDFDWQEALQRARESMPQPKDPEYKFDPSNPFMDHPDPLSEGLRLLKSGALKDAILAFEAAVQKDSNNSEAWRFLGQAQAENEAESQAIAALLKAIAVDPYNLDALMMLGVSYTNDLDEGRALNYLKTWLQNHPDYQHGGVKLQQANLAEYEELYGGGHMGHMGSLDNTLHNEVTKMFLQAVQMNPQDADLHAVLGVLYHISNDFDKAIDAFQHAVQLRPDDAQLWNKLGATQANSSRSAEAIEAYKRALALKPNYVRALANLAISYANLGMHDEASRTYLMTLKQNPDAEHVWGYLRMSLAQLGRDALVEVAKQKNVEAFRPYFEF